MYNSVECLTKKFQETGVMKIDEGKYTKTK